MSQCPTQTVFGEVFTTQTTFIVTNTQSSAPATTQTSLSTRCLATATGGANSGNCASSTVVPVVTVIPGGVTNVPITVTTIIVGSQNVPTRTLFGPCGGNSPTPTPIPITTTPTSLVTQVTDTTLSDGNVVSTTQTFTTTLPPTTTTAPSNQDNNGNGSTSGGGKKTNLAPILGGTIGGIFGILGIVLIFLCYRRRKSRWDDIFEKDDEDMALPRVVKPYSKGAHSVDLGNDPTGAIGGGATLGNEPKPYHYGLVGAAASTPPSTVHSRAPSQVPLMNESTGHSSRPSVMSGESFYGPNGIPQQQRFSQIDEMGQQQQVLLTPGSTPMNLPPGAGGYFPSDASQSSSGYAASAAAAAAAGPSSLLVPQQQQQQQVPQRPLTEKERERMAILAEQQRLYQQQQQYQQQQYQQQQQALQPQHSYQGSVSSRSGSPTSMDHGQISRSVLQVMNQPASPTSTIGTAPEKGGLFIANVPTAGSSSSAGQHQQPGVMEWPADKKQRIMSGASTVSAYSATSGGGAAGGSSEQPRSSIVVHQDGGRPSTATSTSVATTPNAAGAGGKVNHRTVGSAGSGSGSGAGLGLDEEAPPAYTQ